MDPIERAKNQFKAMGEQLPPGPSSPNPERAAGLELLRRRRLDGSRPAVLRDERGESWGCAMVAIPLLDYACLVRSDPELVCKDRDTRNKAWFRLFRKLGSAYGVDASIGRKQRADGVIVR